MAVGNADRIIGLLERAERDGPGRRSIAQHRDPAQSRHFPPGRQHGVRHVRLAQETHGPAIVQEVGELGRSQHHVDGDGHGPQPQDGEVGDHHLGMVVHHVADAITGPHAKPRQARGDARRSGLELAEGHLPPVTDQGHPVRPPAGCHAQDLVSRVHVAFPK